MGGKAEVRSPYRASTALDIKPPIGIIDPLSLGKEDGDRFQVSIASLEGVYNGPLASDTNLYVIGGILFLELPYESLASKLVVLYLRGGAYSKGARQN
ncbi:hypothetical protein F5Y05DRAFT_188529 [Hypoxylon sp. FL0543]|nr:hypothetical protein F5Y05DRAFT_188529 [Hypoxylon sp. FL0543]